MYVNGVCKVCHETKMVIDMLNICGGCLSSWRNDEKTSPETRQAIKWALNSEFGKIPSNQPKRNEGIHEK